MQQGPVRNYSFWSSVAFIYPVCFPLWVCLSEGVCLWCL